MPETVLVADDDAEARSVCRAVLASAGYTVAEAADRAEALRLLRAPRPDVAIVDARLAAALGPDLVAAVGPDTRGATVPLVLLTSAEEAPRRLPVGAWGPAEHLVKPFPPLGLVHLLADLLATSPEEERRRRAAACDRLPWLRAAEGPESG